MEIFRLGSCRIFNILNIFYADIQFVGEPVGHTHTLKEHIQLVKFLRGQISIPPELLKYIFTFWGGDQKRRDIEEVVDRNRSMIDRADMYLVEVCSLKILQYGDFFFQASRFGSYQKWHIEKPGDELVNNTRIYAQEEAEFQSDFAALVELLYDKPIIFTSHLNVRTKQSEYIPARMCLYEWVKKYAGVYGKYYYDLSAEVEKDPNRYIQDDLNHLKPAALRLANWRIAEIITGQPLPVRAKLFFFPRDWLDQAKRGLFKRGETKQDRML